MWVVHEDFDNWEVWTGAIWPGDSGIPPQCGDKCRILRRVVPWVGPKGEHKKCWRYQPLHGAHYTVPTAPKPEVEDRKMRAANDD